MNDVLISLIRTTVMTGVGVVLTWLAVKTGFVLDDNTSAALTAGVTGAVIAGYYLVARALEARFPWLGKFLLGVGAAPKYGSSTSDEA